MSAGQIIDIMFAVILVLVTLNIVLLVRRANRLERRVSALTGRSHRMQPVPRNPPGQE